MSIRKLREAVEAGKLTNPGNEHWLAEMPRDTWEPIVKANSGSLDAAKRLHDALLPGFAPSVGQNVWHRYWFATITTTTGDSIGDSFSGQSTDNPARAWLLAILRALEEEGRDG